ncbi:MAG: hypothetical protein JSS81_24430 [Acidobacteria bacterium]|nr:hypothetical protein [Acidobacteriota bacterium]
MKLAIIELLLITTAAGIVFGQTGNRTEFNGLAELFPEIRGCRRAVLPPVWKETIFEQSADYELTVGTDNAAAELCGRITLRIEPGLRTKTRREFAAQPQMLFNRKYRFKNFEAYSYSPQCGNDPWLGTNSVYFDADKVLTVEARRGGAQLFEFLEQADYSLLKDKMEDLIRSRPNRN